MEDTGNDDEGREKKEAQLTVTELDESEFMGSNLWGDLQSYINLADAIFAKLLFLEFFQLRLVCKEALLLHVSSTRSWLRAPWPLNLHLVVEEMELH